MRTDDTARRAPAPQPSAKATTTRDRWIALAVAFVTTLLFFFESFHSGGKQASYVFDGDAWHVSGAQFALENFFLRHGIFSGIDFFTENGASEFFLRPNLPAYQPLFMLGALVAKITVPWSDIATLSVAKVYVGSLAIAAFFSAFFLQRLGRRFLRLDLWLSAFVALGYVFSVEMLHAFWCPPFPLIAWMFPIACYAGLTAARAGSKRAYLIASAPTFMMYIGGYVPLALVSLGLSALFILWHELDEHQALPPRKRWTAVGKAYIPTLIATLVATPFYIAAVRYHSTVEIANIPGANTLNAVAHTLYEAPRNLLNLFTDSLSFGTQRYEFTLFWGLIPVLIFVIYMAVFKPEMSATPPASTNLRNPRNIIFTTLGAYVLLLLATFGPYSPVSDMVYHFVPVAGYMHIYQRYLVLMQLALMIGIAFMLKELMERPCQRVAKVLLVLFGLALVAAAQMVGQQPWTTPAISNGFVVELFLAFIFLVTLIVGSRRAIVATATACMFLVSLSALNRYTDPPSVHFGMKRAQNITFDPAETAGVVNYLRQNSTKAITKYVDLLPGPQPFMPKNFPWFVAKDIKLSSYYGYDWHVGTDHLYRNRMGIAPVAGETLLSFQPDWTWLQRTGADFVLYKEDSKGTDPKMEQYIDRSNPARIFRFAGPNHYILAPLKFPPVAGNPVVFDNGYIRVQSADRQAAVTGFSTNNAGDIAFAIKTAAPASVDYLFWPNQHTRLRIDGAAAEFVDHDGLARIQLEPGDHKVRILYSNSFLKIFLVFYALYALLLALAGGSLVVDAGRSFAKSWRKPRKRSA